MGQIKIPFLVYIGIFNIVFCYSYYIVSCETHIYTRLQLSDTIVFVIWSQWESLFNNTVLKWIIYSVQ